MKLTSADDERRANCNDQRQRTDGVPEPFSPTESGTNGLKLQDTVEGLENRITLGTWTKIGGRQDSTHEQSSCTQTTEDQHLCRVDIVVNQKTNQTLLSSRIEY